MFWLSWNVLPVGIRSFLWTLLQDHLQPLLKGLKMVAWTDMGRREVHHAELSGSTLTHAESDNPGIWSYITDNISLGFLV